MVQTRWVVLSVTLGSTRPLWTVIQRSILVWFLSAPNSPVKSPDRTNTFPLKMGFEPLMALRTSVAIVEFASIAARSDPADTRRFEISLVYLVSRALQGVFLTD